jgi:hypothetical protein
MHFNIIRQHNAQDDSHLLKINSCSTSHIQCSISVPSCKKTSLHNKRSQHPSSQIFYTYHTSIIHHYYIYFKPTVIQNKKFVKKYFFIHVFPWNVFTILLFSWWISAAITTNRREILCLFQTLIVTYKTKNAICTVVTSFKTNIIYTYLCTKILLNEHLSLLVWKEVHNCFLCASL